MDRGHKELEKRLRALGNRRRLAILKFLKKGEAPVGEIADEINLSFKSTSRHLAVLAGADIVEKEQRSLRVFYRLASNHPKDVSYIISTI